MEIRLKEVRKVCIMNMAYSVSVIIPTYNSEKTLEYSLKSIRQQRMNQKEIEILVIDGGSTDKTLDIARQYDAAILYNEHRLPEFAKQQGMMAARGKYGIFIDSDEAFTNMDSLGNRLKLLSKYPSVKNVVSTGQVCINGENGVTRYANFIGDPFSNFVYRYNGYNRLEDLKRQYHYKDIGKGILLDLKKCRFFPLFDALGNMFEIETARKLYRQRGKDPSFAANIFSNMVEDTRQAIAMKCDFICHRAGMSTQGYLSKIRWRVKNNLFATKGVGFAQRSKRETVLQRRRLLFVPYCLLLFPVLIDAVRFSLKNKDVYFLNHFWYAEYTFCIIVWYYLLKIIHYPVKMDKMYGKEK